MPEKTRWFDRKFEFAFPSDRARDIVERLRGTPARLEERTRGFSLEVLSKRSSGTWSIQENVGHLLDLEPLWSGRVEDVMQGEERMRPTDLENRKTHDADHNVADLEDLLRRFRSIRMDLVARLDSLSSSDFDRTALHPRLEQPMRIVDLCFFVSEHDDHHLARITELARLFES